ncbi:ATP synthase regulation protein NCA2 domain containing protein [Naviculisporaceae sp. PSN 640]
MSLVTDSLAALDSRIDSASKVYEDEEQSLQTFTAAVNAQYSPRIVELLRIVKALSHSPTSDQRLQPESIERLILLSGLTERANPAASEAEEDGGEGDEEDPQLLAAAQLENDVEWLLLGKATVQTYGLVMQTFLDQIIPLNDDIWYWDDILHSYSYSCLYTVQSSPLRMWAWTSDIYHDSALRLQRLSQRMIWDNTTQHGRNQEADTEGQAPPDEEADNATTISFDTHTWIRTSLPRTLSIPWRRFYSIVRESIAERAIKDLRRRVMSPVDLSRSEARRKRDHLQRVKATTATGLGMLMSEGFDWSTTNPATQGGDLLGWRGALDRTVSLMDTLLQNVATSADPQISEFENRVITSVQEDPEVTVNHEEFYTAEKTSFLARRLLTILQQRIPSHVTEFSALRNEHGRPSKLVRYWLPGITLIASSSTILRILFRRQDEIINWMRELGKTTRDFYLNWVVEPVRKIIATIRHDTTSEIAIMSRDSLKADRESLERMVVDFALDKPDIAVGASSITEKQIADIRAKVREGDVTPILKAYEKDLRQPFVGAIRGDLVRALLVQIQKTKVDLEVAISGIDALLKSQELVFGFLGLTPGVLVSLAVFRYLATIFGGREGLRRSQKARRSVRVLRKIHRILSEVGKGQPLSYQESGLLFCEVHVLRNLSQGVLPSDIGREFVEDLGDLANVRSVETGEKIVERVRWAYPEVWK